MTLSKDTPNSAYAGATTIPAHNPSLTSETIQVFTSDLSFLTQYCHSLHLCHLRHFALAEVTIFLSRKGKLQKGPWSPSLLPKPCLIWGSPLTKSTPFLHGLPPSIICNFPIPYDNVKPNRSQPSGVCRPQADLPDTHIPAGHQLPCFSCHPRDHHNTM